MLKDSPAMQETWVGSLGREDPLEKEMARKIPWKRKSTPVFLPGKPMVRKAWQATVHGVPRVEHDLTTEQFNSFQNMPLQHKNDFELKAAEIKGGQGEFSAPALSA